MKLRYVVQGSGAGDAAYELTGEVEGTSPIDPEAHDRATRAAFHQLTSGKAVFGKPGEGGCHGPYKVSRLTLEMVAQDQPQRERESV